MQINNDLAFSSLSTEQIEAVKRFEEDFNSRFEKEIYLLACTEKATRH